MDPIVQQVENILVLRGVDEDKIRAFMKRNGEQSVWTYLGPALDALEEAVSEEA